MNLRAVDVVTLDGETVYIPSSMVWRSPVVNVSAKPDRRSSLVVGVAYDTDLDHAKAVLEQAISAVDGVLDSRPVTAQFFEFGDSSINFMLRYWHEPSTAVQWRLWDEVGRSVKRAIDEASIEIPIPQRVVHLEGSSNGSEWAVEPSEA